MLEKIVKLIPQRHLEHLGKKPKIEFKSLLPNSITNNSFSLMTWNILASGYSRPDVYYYVNPDYLHEDYRFSMAYYDIMSNFSDIIALQEVERRIFDKLLSLCNEDYYGIYEKRSGLTCDGLAMLFKKKMLKQVDYELIQLNKIPQKILNCIPNQSLHKKIASTHNLAQIIIFEPIEAKMKEKIDYLIVVNLHLFWNPNMEIIKYTQASTVINKLDEIYRKLKSTSDNKISVIVSGDFNSVPGSSVLDLFKRKIYPEKIEEKNKEAFQKIFDQTNQSHNHKLNFKDTHDEHPYVTNIKPDFNGKLDHIFYSNEELFKGREVSFVDTNHYLNEKALPNSFHGSDHLFLISKFYL